MIMIKTFNPLACNRLEYHSLKFKKLVKELFNLQTLEGSTNEIVDAKRLVILELRHLGYNVGNIADVFSSGDHSLIIYHSRKAKDLLETDREFQNKYNRFKQYLYG